MGEEARAAGLPASTLLAAGQSFLLLRSLIPPWLFGADARQPSAVCCRGSDAFHGLSKIGQAAQYLVAMKRLRDALASYRLTCHACVGECVSRNVCTDVMSSSRFMCMHRHLPGYKTRMQRCVPLRCRGRVLGACSPEKCDVVGAVVSICRFMMLLPSFTASRAAFKSTLPARLARLADPGDRIALSRAQAALKEPPCLQVE